MADEAYVTQLMKGVANWNAWRNENPDIDPDISQANLSGVDLSDAKLSKVNLSGADLGRANLFKANLSGANLNGANLREAHLGQADLSKAHLETANLFQANLSGANLSQAKLSRMSGLQVNFSGANLSGATLAEAFLVQANLAGADLSKTSLFQANLSNANLQDANLAWSNLMSACLSRADLRNATLRPAVLSFTDLTAADLSGVDLSEDDLERSLLIETDVKGASLDGCRVYGTSVWNVKTNQYTKQKNLIITARNEPEVSVDNIEVAQFVYLLLNNAKIRDVIDTITSKAVLILGRFTDERKAVLDALRDELRKSNYLPIIFDFEVPARRNITETVTLLARMARFIIADLTAPSSIPQELQAIIPSVRVPVQPLLLEGSSLYSMFKDFDPQDFHWVLPVYRYKGLAQLLATLAEKVIAPAEGKVKALEERRRLIEAELTKAQ